MKQLHVIAVSKKMNANKEADSYICLDGKIYSYFPQWELDTCWEYDKKIREVAINVDKGLLEWVDLYIDDGQEIMQKGGKIYIDRKEVQIFRRLSSDVFANISFMSSKIFNEFMYSKELTNEEDKEFMRSSFEDGLFLRQISDIVESKYQTPLEINELTNLDKQIIVRTKIEGYQFIINFLKNILHSNANEKLDYCVMFLSRVFILESQNFIKV